MFSSLYFQLNKENVNRPPAELTANPVRVLVSPDENNAANNVETDERQGQETSQTTSEPPAPITLQSIEGSSVHFLTKPQVYKPKVRSTTTAKSVEKEKPKINLKTVKVIKKFLEEQKENFNLEYFNVFKFVTDIINFKKSKFEELKDFLEYKTARWEKIINNKKSKLAELLSKNEILDFTNLKNFKEARVEDLIELIKLKKLKLEELTALNKLVALKQSKIEEVKNLLDYKKGKIEELFSSSNVFVYPEKEVVVPDYNSFPAEVNPPTNIAYEGRSPGSEIRFYLLNYSNHGWCDCFYFVSVPSLRQLRSTWPSTPAGCSQRRPSFTNRDSLAVRLCLQTTGSSTARTSTTSRGASRRGRRSSS